MRHGEFQRLQVSQCVGASNAFDTAHASGHARFAHHLEQTDVSGALHVGAAAQLAAGADVQHAHGFAVLFTEQHHGAGLLGAFDVHHAGIGRGVGQNFSVHAGFDLADLLGRHGCVVRKVKTGAVSVDQRALLLHVGAQHFAQGLVHDVGDRVVTHGGSAHGGVHLRFNGIAHLQAAGFQHAVVAEDVGLDLQGVFHGKACNACGDHALVAHLTAGLCIKRSAIQHHHAVLASFQLRNRYTIGVQSYDFCSFCQLVVTNKGVAFAGVFQRAVHLELAGSAGRFLLVLHGGVKAGLVHRHATLARHVVGQVEREAVGVVQLEGHIAGQHLDVARQGTVQNFHAVGQGLEEALFFGLEHAGDVRLLLLELGVGIAHLHHQISH